MKKHLVTKELLGKSKEEVDKPGASYQLPGLSLPGSGWGLFTPGLKYALPVVGH